MKPNNFRSRLLMALFFFLVILGAVFLGFGFLRKYSSRAFVVNKLIQNIAFENENSLKTKDLLVNNLNLYQLLKSYTIYTEDEIPFVVGELESYAEYVNTSMKIVSITVSQPVRPKPANPEENAPAPVENKKLNIDIQSSGSFNNLIKLLKLFENSRYVIGVEKYNLRQVIQSSSALPGGDVFFIELTPTSEILENQKKIWLLSASLSMSTYIK